MFSKSTKPQPKIETVVGAGSEIDGDIHTKHGLRVDGLVRGQIKADSVMIGENGIVLGDMTANHITIAGKIKGNITAHAVLEVIEKGHVIGDIIATHLIVADGAKFEGRCHMTQNDGQVIEMDPKSIGLANSLQVVGENT